MIKVVNSSIQKETIIEKINPLVKVIAVFSFGLSTLVFPNFWLGLVLIVVLFGFAIPAKKLKEFSKVMFSFGIPITLMLLFIQGCYSPKNVTIIAKWGIFTVGREGVLYALKIVVTLLVFLGSFYLMNKTTYMGELIASLTETGLSPKAGYLVLASLNVVPQMQRRMGIIKEAQEARGVETKGNVFSRIKAYVPLLGPVVMSSLTDAQERGMTLETRGFGIVGVKPTSLFELEKTRSDKVLKIVLICFFVITILVSLAMRFFIV